MFGWGRKKDGFEWHDYVRTTILVRRAKRREHLREAQQKAFGEVQNVRRRSAEAGAAGVQAMGRGAVQMAHGARRLSLQFAMLSAQAVVEAARFLGRFALSAGRRFENASTVFWRWLGQIIRRMVPDRLALPVGVVGLASIAGAVSQFTTQGLTNVSLIAGALGVLALGIAYVCWVKALQWSEVSRTVTGVARQLPGLNRDSKISAGIARGARLTASLVVVALFIFAAGAYAVHSIWPFTTASKGAWPAFSFSSLFERERIKGRGKVLTGDTIRISGQKIRLSGIEAPERAQTCETSKQKKWKCGVAAAAALAKLIRRREITCYFGSAARDDVRTGTCQVRDKDIAAQLVREGYVFAKPGWFAAYGSLERQARQTKTGIWQGTPQRPDEFRASHWETASKAAPDGCPIKGRASSRGKFYVLPWSRRYKSYVVRRKRGDRWFCSEREAQQAGWKPMDRG